MNDFSHDRAAGVLLGQACGDALGVPYEFGPALPPTFIPEMKGGGPFGFAPGEYSDDTSMAVCIAEVAATGADLTDERSLDEIAERFLTWAPDGSLVDADLTSIVPLILCVNLQSDTCETVTEDVARLIVRK